MCSMTIGVILRGERVAGERVLQLGDGADVAGAQLGDRDLLLALQHLQLAEALFVSRLVFQYA